jgi:ABC-type nitrate/sulfonate/bicarbonate transport system permease component
MTIFQESLSPDRPGVFSGIIMIAILGLALDAALRGLLLLADPARRT